MREQLTEQERDLLDLARGSGTKAYAPYSGFRVGAAVVTDVGTFSGCNVENASYGLCMCAERTAIFQAVAKGASRISLVAVSCLDAAPESAVSGKMPCGACRQVISEFADGSVPVVVDGAGVWNVEDLLPLAFVLK